MSVVLNRVEGHVATLTLNRPDRLNAMDGELLAAVLASLEAHAEDDDVRVVIMTGAGRGFCAGGDLRLLGARGGGKDAAAESATSVATRVRDMRGLTEISRLLHTMPKVTIAAVNGPCAGAGLSWACAADLRYAADTAVFTTAFARAGQPGDYGGTWFLPRLVGAGRARELFLRSTRFDAAAARDWGLVNEVVPGPSLLEHVGAIATEIAGFAPVAIRLMKANLNDGETLPLDQLLDAEAERFYVNAATDDAGEAARAFIEKRPPRFEGA
jgi:2-(1,2-epoxy-1,2-dihydrophenyl)acetyl-CoA isomerase